MVRLDVNPVTDNSSLYRRSVPLARSSRVMLSSHDFDRDHEAAVSLSLFLSFLPLFPGA